LEAAVLRKHPLAGLASLNDTILPSMHREEFRAMGTTISLLIAGLLVRMDVTEETTKLWSVHMAEEQL
jgi:hypothetical protein